MASRVVVDRIRNCSSVKDSGIVPSCPAVNGADAIGTSGIMPVPGGIPELG